MLPAGLNPDKSAVKVKQVLAVEMGPFSERELHAAIRGLKSGKATRDGDICIEVFKTFAQLPGPALKAFLDLFNECLSSQCFPEE